MQGDYPGGGKGKNIAILLFIPRLGPKGVTWVFRVFMGLKCVMGVCSSVAKVGGCGCLSLCVLVVDRFCVRMSVCVFGWVYAVRDSRFVNESYIFICLDNGKMFQVLYW